MKTLLTLVTLAFSLSANAADMAKKTLPYSDDMNSEAAIAQLFNESAAKAGTPIANKVAALKKEYASDELGLGEILDVEAAHVWLLSHGRSGQYSGGTYLVSVWYAYKAHGSQVAWAIARTQYDELNSDVVTITIEKFVNKLGVGDY